MKLPLLLLLATVAARAASLEIEIQHAYGANALALDSLRYELPSGETHSVERLSYLLSGFSLARKDGGWADLPGQVAWIDAVSRRTTATLQGIPPGEYRALRFAVGLDPATNASDPAKYPATHPLNPNLNGLHWTWQGGFIFLAIEGLHRTGNETPRGYSYHFARDPNRTEVTLPLGLRLGPPEAGVVRLGFDIAALLGKPRPLSFAKAGDSTHSREGDPIAMALRANLSGAFSVREVGKGKIPLPETPVVPIDLPEKYTPYQLTISDRFPIPPLPRDNPLIEERVALGRRLFNEPLLSRDGTLSCSTCHVSANAFTDPRRFSSGMGGQQGTRNGMPLFNLAWKSSFFWDGRAPSLRIQALMPIQDHTEMDEKPDRVAAKLRDHAEYPALFAKAFSTNVITPERIGLAIENFVLTLVSCDSKFDRVMRGAAEFAPEEKRGFDLFFTENEPRSGQFGADCFHCHGGALFTDHQFRNNGLAIDEADPGRARFTGSDRDRGKFSTPSLRNIARTAPYMHDGRFTTLEQVLDHYAGGVQRTATLDPNLAKHPNGGLPLTAEQKSAVIAFLHTLTDESFPPK